MQSSKQEFFEKTQHLVYTNGKIYKREIQLCPIECQSQKRMLKFVQGICG